MDNTTTHEISLQTAIDMTTLYRANRPSNFPICETFEVDAINKLLATDGCVFFRIYYGMKENLLVDAILVAVNAEGEDILPSVSKLPPGRLISSPLYCCKRRGLSEILSR
jgi:hypothetical protein